MRGLVALLVVPLLWPLPAHAAAEPGSGFASVSLTAVATGQSMLPDPSRGAPGQLDVPYAASEIRLGAGRATATVAWPGETGAALGDALIALGAPPQAQALNHPVLTRARTGSGEPDVRNDQLPGTTMEAHARLHDVSAATTTQLVDALATTAGRTAAATRVRLTGPAKAVGEAASSVRDVTIAGVVHVGAVTSRATGWSDGSRADAEGGTVVSDLSVAGTAVTIGPDGLTVAGSAVPAGPALAAVNEALSQAGVSLALGERTEVVRGGVVEYATGSLVVTTPLGVVSLGGVQLRLATTAAAGELVDLPPLPPPPLGDPPSAGAPLAAGGDLPATGGPPPPATSGGVLPPVLRDVVAALSPVSLTTGFAPGWVVLGLLATAVSGALLRGLPTTVLPAPAAPCQAGPPHEERP